MKVLKNILLSERPLLISNDGYRQAVDIAFLPAGKSFLTDPPTYKEETDKAVACVRKLLSESEDNIEVTNDFENTDLPENTVAYHRVYGFITGGSRWYFSSKQLEADLIAAEANPSICAHLLHIDSYGGEAWYLDRLTETMRGCKKPIVGIYEDRCASAAYYIGCHADVLYATTENDFVGCIGTMTSFYDWDGYYEKMGVKLVEAKATMSDLKNKTFDDLVDGKPAAFIENVLNPLNDQFIAAVRSQRPKLASMDNDNPVLRGETYYTPAAIENGLIDGKRTLAEAIAEAHALGCRKSESSALKDSIYELI